MTKPDSGTSIASATGMRWFGITIGALVCASTYLLVGCVGELREIVPEADMSVAVDLGEDLTTAPNEMGPSGIKFFPDIQNDLNAKFCGNPGCHGTGSNMPTFILNPTMPADQDTNYNSFTGFAINAAAMTDPSMSPMLMILLPGGGHGGGQQLASTTDPVYVRWRTWIADGGPR